MARGEEEGAAALAMEPWRTGGCAAGHGETKGEGIAGEKLEREANRPCSDSPQRRSSDALRPTAHGTLPPLRPAAHGKPPREEICRAVDLGGATGEEVIEKFIAIFMHLGD